mmetsp:Transcript_49652/g.101389  ORF Transcript_49652/g.101389 Transcript_49652/m.101389 type:complete len:212 (+) Transcript_49652:536-1171(+)
MWLGSCHILSTRECREQLTDCRLKSDQCRMRTRTWSFGPTGKRCIQTMCTNLLQTYTSQSTPHRISFDSWHRERSSYSKSPLETSRLERCIGTTRMPRSSLVSDSRGTPFGRTCASGAVPRESGRTSGTIRFPSFQSAAPEALKTTGEFAASHAVRQAKEHAVAMRTAHARLTWMVRFQQRHHCIAPSPAKIVVIVRASLWMSTPTMLEAI